jgi:hypothetical protein
MYRVYKNDELYLENTYYPSTKGECYVYSAQNNWWTYQPPSSAVARLIPAYDVPAVYRAINLLLCQGDTK